MRILVIPTTDWLRHPVPHRLNFIFDKLAQKHEIHVLHFNIKRFRENKPRFTNCVLHAANDIQLNDITLYYICNMLKHRRKVVQIVQQNGIELIVSANILPSFMASVFSKIPIVYDYSDYLEESASIYYSNSVLKILLQSTTRTLTNFNLNSAICVTTVTHLFKKYLKSIGVKNIHIIPNGVAIDLLKPIHAERAKNLLNIEGTVIGYVGSLEYWLDLETVLYALAVLMKKTNEFRDLKLLLVGVSLYTDYSRYLKRIASELGIANKIIFTGAVEYQKLALYISAMDVCINPRKPILLNKLTIGGKVFDYLACGKPVLSSNTPALAQLFTEKDGVFCYNSKSELIKMLQKVLKCNHDAHQYRAVASKYDWNIIASKFENVLKKV